MMRRRFIALEGGEGTGKSTQARLLASELERRGVETLLTREPGGTPGAEAIRALLLNPLGEGWGMRAEALLFAAARSDHVERLIRPALEGGRWVVCDRFLDSSRAYQGSAGMLGDELVRGLHGYGSEGLLPDLTLVIAVDETTAAARLAARDGAVSDAIGGRQAAYHSNVNAAFVEFAAAEPERFALIDGEGSVDEVHGRIVAALEPLLATGSRG
ncbi:dTMP kinase [Erythrobacter sp. QSSC1-22B]|uniref:dTMP kinase n=1 Tax=Erythrobacter sp. QSSC1-22B TaxID=1860125 RepID=UPI0008059B64|nr:dTMP kinase [Erythrobacter sp. QSSC1-22B]OBX20252.1 dTMP kinase [Erythrobacter sp. QSSC1-22B]